MTFGIEKCGMLILKKDHSMLTDDLRMPNGTIKDIEEEYKYLGIMQSNINHESEWSAPHVDQTVHFTRCLQLLTVAKPGDGFMQVLPHRSTNVNVTNWSVVKSYFDLNLIPGYRETMNCLGSLTLLRKLELFANPIKVLPESITALSSLEELNLSGCQLSQLPESLGSLTSLRKLDLSRNPIKVLPESITALSSLEELSLSGCQLSQLPERCHSLQMLRNLSLSSNNIQSLPFWIYKLERLVELVLRENTKLEKIESAVLEMKSLVHLDCRGCENLKVPPYSVCKQGIDAIRKFFVDLAAEKPVKLVEVPVAVIGNTLSGKTSLFRTLKTGKRVLTHRDRSSEQDETTRVFQVEDLPLETTEVKLFDYGGNQVYHLAYQILSEEKCVPLIVVDLADFAKRVRANGAEIACKQVCFDWLSHLYLACTKLGPPILVLTHVDELTSDQITQTRKELLTAAESIRRKLLKEENQLASLFPKVLNVIEHLSNRHLPLFDDDEIFEFGIDPEVTSNIEHLKKKLNERCKDHIVELPKLWSSVELFIQQASHQPYVKLSQVLEKFPDDDPVIILRYMHNAGRVFFFEKLQGLSGYIFHKFSEITTMINLLFHHRSQNQWDDHLSKFEFFAHQGRVIHKLEYGALVQRYLHDGILAEALLKNLLSNSAFPFDVSIELLKSFLLMHGPIGKSTHAEFLIPAVASEFMEDVANMKNRMQLRLDIILEGLPIPMYVHHQLSVAVLNLLCNPVCQSSAFKSGVTIAQGNSVTTVQHNFNERVITVSIATIPKELSTSWQRLIGVTDAIIRQLSQSWKACHVAVRTYCSHCLFRGDRQPEFQVNPEWLYSVYEANGEAKLKVSMFSGVEPVICQKYSTSSPNVPLPLKFPYIDQVSSLSIDPDSDLSDVEQEGYCDEKKSHQKIIMRLISTSKKPIKALFEKKKEVILIS
ncbi:malignant fibrous histiocytoma-amplified sequence 1 homolog [Watersipora subatra]|uniref:malignant fibrous histiocytoma-amplified sequence 1 homolog n=1 Tax=Watersipora subatra TaxID=2589382 RepID=UPI00355B6F45